MDEPFYASTTPQTYVIAAATVIAWVLVIMLVISPQGFHARSGAGSSSLATGRGIIGGATAGSPGLVGIGSRPWLQKVAALTVAVALTIATADTFKVSQRQYLTAFLDGNALRVEVENSLEVRITRVISDIFVWLAQVQTLIRLFPRHKEKVLIKWIGFALIVLDTTFSCLNSFFVNSTHRPRDYVDAIPALSYLFELSLGLLYAAWVIYYAMTKRRYAFYHSKMKNISLLALLSLVSILTPVVFFVTDVTVPDVAGWGDYFRWVGAAAASVVVWEWVERIEALERDEKKDGILGREIFDGDDMLDITPSEEMTYTRRKKDRYYQRRRGDDGSARPGTSRTFTTVTGRFQSQARAAQSSAMSLSNRSPGVANERRAVAFGDLPRPQATATGANRNSSPLNTISPPPRTDTTSAASTVYVIRDDGNPDVPQPVRRRADPSASEPNNIDQEQSGSPRAQTRANEVSNFFKSSSLLAKSHWHPVPNPFKRKRGTPPAEVRAAINASEAKTKVASDKDGNPTDPMQSHSYSRWDLSGRLGAFAAEQSERLRERAAAKQGEVDLPWTVIPAQPRGAAAWSPALKEALELEDLSESQSSPKEAPSTTDDGSGPSVGTEESTIVDNLQRPDPITHEPQDRLRPPSVSRTGRGNEGNGENR